MNSLRLEADTAQQLAEERGTKIKALEQENLTKEQDIVSLTHQKSLLEAENERLEKALAEAKAAADTGASNSAELDASHRKVQLLEEEAEVADKNLRETNEKYVHSFMCFSAFSTIHAPPVWPRLTSRFLT
jgi:tropomyosin